MTKYWPTLSTGTADSFWAHEWTTHGSCAVYGGSFATQGDFFKGTLEIRAQYDAIPAFKAAGIVPDNNAGTTTKDLTNAFYDAYGVDIELDCDSNGYITGYTMCVDSTSLQAMQCPSNVRGKCSASTVYLPSTLF
jgi:ribonuclease I